MTGARYRAWRFYHPDLDAAEGFQGLSLSPTGSISMVEEHATVRQAIFLLLSTMPGERVMRPDYGCELFKLVFSPNDDTTAGLAIHYVRKALDRWEPRIEILRLDAGRDDAYPGRLDITLDYRLLGARGDQRMGFSLNLQAEEP